MPDFSKLKSSAAARLAVLTGLACVACCSMPLLGAALGSALVAGLGWYFDLAAMVLAGLAVGAFMLSILKRKPAACDIDGACKSD